MVAAATLPNVASRLTDAAGLITREWRDFLLKLSTETDNAALAGQLNALALRVGTLEDEEVLFSLLGLGSVQVIGPLVDGAYRIELKGDAEDPGPTWYYGTGPDGVKGFFRLYDALSAGVGLIKTDSGYVMLGEVATVADLPGSGNIGEAWRVLDPAGLWAWDGAGWALDPAPTGVVGFRLDELADTGVGAALVKITRDVYGRVEGTEAATTDDLTEGAANLYFTAARVRATVLTGISFVSATAITAADTVLSALGKLQAQITSLAASVAGLIVQTITNGDTTHAPSGDVVFDALALKAPLDTPSFTGPVSMTFGAASGITLSDTTTDATTKDARILARHYANAEESIAVFGAASYNPASFVPGSIAGGNGNDARFGGGFGIQNAATALRFFTAPDQITLGGTLRWAVNSSGHLLAGADNAYTFGDASHRPSVLWAASGTISTSDAREKTVRGSLNEQELAAGLEIASAAVIYQWNDAIALKGEAARLHCGPTVQDVIAIMESHGLDPFRYGFVCYDEWSETPEVWEEWQEETDEDGNVIREAGRVLAHEYRPAGNRYSLRADELAAFRDAALAQNQQVIMTRLAALESG